MEDGGQRTEDRGQRTEGLESVPFFRPRSSVLRHPFSELTMQLGMLLLATAAAISYLCGFVVYG
jgi:hypothetical protein